MFNKLWRKVLPPKYDFSKWGKIVVANDGSISTENCIDSSKHGSIFNPEYAKAIRKAAKSRKPPPNFILVECLPPLSKEV